MGSVTKGKSSELQRANELFQKSQVTSGVSKALRIGYLEQAIQIYNSELAKAPATKYYVHSKNIGVANYRLAELLDPKYDMQQLMYRLSEAVRNYCNAWKSSPFPRNSAWPLQVEEYVSDAFQSAFTALQGIKPVTERLKQVHLLDNIGKAIGTHEPGMNNFKFDLHLAKGQYFYRCGVEALASDDFKSILRLCEYSREEGELGLKYADKKAHDKLEDIQRLQEDYTMLLCSCESIRHRKQADGLFDKYLNQSEEVNFDMMWAILDMYKAATLSCQEKDIENEAIALARQGRLFEKLFKLDIKAKTYYRRAFDLAQTLMPRDLSKLDWFQECTQALERYQKKVVEEEEAKKAAERAKYLPKIRDAIRKLDESAGKGSYDLLTYLYATHPPKNAPDFKYDPKGTNASNLKKTLMKAITQYHPDKQVQHGMEWKVLCEEITKVLTAKYECMKGI